jgi:hypothetical protein
MQPLPHRGMEPQKRKYVTQITDGRGAASYVGDNRHTHWKKGTRHDLDFGPHGRRALHRPRHAHCAVVDLHSGLKARTASSAHSKLGRPDFQAPAARNGGRFAVLALITATGIETPPPPKKRPGVRHGSGTRTFSTPCVTPSWRRTGSRTFGAIRQPFPLMVHDASFGR